MKLTVKSVLIVLSITLSFGKTFAQKTEYYRHLLFLETHFSDIEGVHPINKQESKNEAHYRFVYDKKNRLIEVSHRIGDDIISRNGNWDSFIWFSPKMTIAYEKGKEIRSFYNNLDEQIEAHGKMYKAVFNLDNKGSRKALKIYDKDNKPSQNRWGVHRYEWTIEDKGTVIEKRFNLKNEPTAFRPDLTFYTVRLDYGNDNQLDFMYHIDENGNLKNNSLQAGLDRIVYDNEGNFSRWMVFDKDRKPVEGNQPQLAIGEHLYDSKGNKVELRGYDVMGRVKAMPDGVARELKSYDSFNNLIEVKNLDIKGKLLEHIKREYSEDGRRMEWLKFLDDQGNLTMHSRFGFAALKFEYDTKGRLKGRKRFDAEMKEIAPPRRR